MSNVHPLFAAILESHLGGKPVAINEGVPCRVTAELRQYEHEQERHAEDDIELEEVPMEISDRAAAMLYKAAKVALARGNLEAITEHLLRDAVKAAEAL